MKNENIGITLHQLKIFWTVAQASSFTKASKILGLAQPSLSQQISKLEDEVGSLLFKRGRSKMSLTEAGQFLQRRAEIVLSGVEETMVGLRQFGSGQKGLISVGLLSSVARNLLPSASEELSKKFPDIELDILEISPAEAIDLLYGRQLSVAVLAEDSIAKSILSFSKSNLFEDPYVLAVPKNISLKNIKNLEDLKKSKESKVLNNIIQFEFGNQHKKRIEEWFTSVLPDSRVFAKTRTYEVALSMVQSGRGVAVVPALAARLGGKKIDFDVNLYKTNLPQRKIISLIPSQYIRIEPYKSFINALVETGKNMKLPKTYDVPPILESLSI
ncbi:MAG: LysR family transcriptional regulator [Alphaproteobacteria bacterium]